jgi:hypothetical protein
MRNNVITFIQNLWWRLGVAGLIGFFGWSIFYESDDPMAPCIIISCVAYFLGHAFQTFWEEKQTESWKKKIKGGD